MTTLISGIITYILYTGVVILASTNAIKYRKCAVGHVSEPLKLLAVYLSILQVVMALLFMSLQSDWLFMDYNTILDSETTVAWLMFDALNGLVHLSMSLILKTYYEFIPLSCDDRKLTTAMKSVEERLLLSGIQTDTGLRLIPCVDYQEDEEEMCNTPCKEYCKFNKDVVYTCKVVSDGLTKDINKVKDILERIKK